MPVEALLWQDDCLHILDQRLLPHKEAWIVVRTWEEVASAITDMAVRGAPLIGVAAAYGMALAQRTGADLGEARAGLTATRPTAVNLFHALDRVSAAEDKLAAAQALEAEERHNNDLIAAAGASLITAQTSAVTICNTGSLATPGVGTALGVLRRAHAQGKIREVFALETRPRLQGLRLTAWELGQDGIPFRVIPDGAAPMLLSRGDVGFAVAGADRIAANGDTANKIGTYALALACREHSVPFVIVAPTSTIDPNTPEGADIPIEERASEEVTEIDGVRVAPDGCQVWNPAFDVTPARLIGAIVTEQGVHRPPFAFGALPR
ncbi:MAG: S-methyl-5-thioribose-1-phosphate isomerase [Fimbriimonadales bacterium]